MVRQLAHGLLVLVLAPVVPVDEEEVEQAGAPAADDGDLGRAVLRRVGGAEGLGAWIVMVRVRLGLEVGMGEGVEWDFWERGWGGEIE